MTTILRLPIIRHVRYFYGMYRVNQHYAHWRELGYLPVNADHDYAVLGSRFVFLKRWGSPPMTTDLEALAVRVPLTKAKEAAEALSNLNIFAAVVAILEGGTVHIESNAATQRIIKACQDEQQRCLRRYVKLLDLDHKGRSRALSQSKGLGNG